MPITLGFPTAGPRRRAGDVDRHVGRRIRERRVMLGISQERLADAIGCSSQQIHKRESGRNRVSAEHLYQIANVLGVGVSFFFEGLEQGEQPVVTATQQRVFALLQTYMRLAPGHQHAVSALARSLLPDDGGEG